MFAPTFLSFAGASFPQLAQVTPVAPMDWIELQTVMDNIGPVSEGLGLVSLLGVLAILGIAMWMFARTSGIFLRRRR